jgi:hypothetical protein
MQKKQGFKGDLYAAESEGANMKFRTQHGPNIYWLNTRFMLVDRHGGITRSHKKLAARRNGLDIAWLVTRFIQRGFDVDNMFITVWDAVHLDKLGLPVYVGTISAWKYVTEHGNRIFCKIKDLAEAS